MTRNAHDEARGLIALRDGLSQAQHTWLRSHLDECEACRNYAEAADEVIHSLRSFPVAADSRLVRATQMRVRFHAGRLRQARQRMWLVGMACLAVGLSATVTAPFLWRLFAWLGAWAGVPAMAWQVGFIFFSIAPALGVGVLLLARGTHVTGNGEDSRQWR
jgi:predicted anti-sigma-YlaC factor YlaD